MGSLNLPHRLQFDPLKQCTMVGVEDHISTLPDELLSHILSRLTFKEAMASSVLSKRWRLVWTLCPSLDFGCSESLKQMDKDAYVEVVNKVLGLYGIQKMHKLRVVYPLGLDSTWHIDFWVSVAIANRVSSLELDLRDDTFGRSYLYCIKAGVLLDWQTIYRKHCSLVPKSCSAVDDPFVSLKDICLRDVRLGDEDFETILSRCKSLEKLLLMYTRGLVNAKHDNPLLKLKSLEVYTCLDLQRLELLAPNLVTFEYQGWRRIICIKDSHKLGHLRLSITIGADPCTVCPIPRQREFVFGQFGTYIPNLETLMISVHLFQSSRGLGKLFPMLNNLRKLVLSAWWDRLVLGYLVAAFIMRVAPYLEELEIDLPLVSIYKGPLDFSPMPLHHNLKTIKVFCFRDNIYTLDFLVYISRYAPVLETIVITSLVPLRFADDFQIIDDKHSTHAKLHERIQQLREMLPLKIRLMYDGEWVHCK